VARSLEAGIALLEVKGLRRSGVELSADVWPPAEATEYQFVAWPPAEALAEGTPMIRTSVRLEPGPGAAQLVVTPELPGVSGPLFDRCGRMAAFHLGGSDARLLGVGGLEKLARSVDKEVISVTCEPESLTARTETENAAEEPAVVPGSGEAAPSPGVSESVSPGAGEQSVARASWWLAAVLIGLLGIVLYLHIRKNQGGRRILLEGKRAHGRTVNCEVRFPRGGEPARLERQDRTFLFMIDGNRALVTQPDEGIPEVLALAVAGTPCLPGEIFALVDGQEIQLGDELFVARLELDRPKSI
jgi:hypothetical protein